MSELFDSAPEAVAAPAAMKDLLPGWQRVRDTNYLQSPCGRVRIYRSGPIPGTSGQSYPVYVQLAGEWVSVRTCRLELAPAASLAKQVLEELAEQLP
ncbi:hypothetical protein [Abyssibacter profundi]|uniref:Uncharacterized protein n=1 Tax=Abyssibacter profundi TaxID=2182787 RepID=A0A363UL81_9GAMM|nr:hypothetical protein [Abyssibacter profundi]PWN56192.1 hypothetical protein DEH80_07925 [Abyssibacter profundi]